MKISLLLAAAGAAMMMIPADADAAGRFKARGARANANGGVSAAVVAGGPNGVRARGVVTDADGNAIAGSAGCAAGRVCRGARTTYGADGSVSRESGAAFVTPGGAGQTQGQFTRNADGTVSGSRTTSASGAYGDYDASTVVNPDGTASRQASGAYQTETASGSIESSFVRNADGTISGARSTSSSGANGAYSSEIVVDPETGLARTLNAANENGSVAVEANRKRGEGGSRSITCMDASGAVIACPF